MLACIIAICSSSLQISLDGGAAESYSSLADVFSKTFKDIHIISGHATYSDFSKLPQRNNGLEVVTIDHSVVFDDDFVEFSFRNHQNIKNFTFPQLTYLPDSAFLNCKKLQRISCQNVIYINEYALCDCIVLTSVNFPNLRALMAPKKSGQHFSGCSSLNHINFPKLRYIEGDQSFWGCTKLGEANLPQLTITNYQTFSKTGLINVNFPKLVEVDTVMFSSCSKLECVKLEKCTVIEKEAFYNTHSLNNVSIPNAIIIKTSSFENSGITQVSCPKLGYIGYEAFNNCTSLIEFSAEKTKYMEKNAFELCSKMEIFNISDCINFNHLYKCDSLKIMEVGLRAINNGDFIQSYKTLEIISFPKLQKVPSVFLHSFSNTLAAYFPKAKVVEIGAFRYCISLEEIQLPEVILFENSTTVNDHFEDCKKLRHLDFPSLIEIRGNGTFNNCELLESVNFPNVISIPNFCFIQCKALKQAIIPKLATIGLNAFESTPIEDISFNNLHIISKYCFHECQSLNSVQIDGCYSIERCAFQMCDSMKSINCPKLYLMECNAFDTCKGLIKVSMPSLFSTVSGNDKNDGFYFSNCTNIEEMSLPNLRSINGAYMFSNCTSLRTFDAPNLEIINSGQSFDCCRRLRDLELKKVVKLGIFAFQNCTGLTQISFPNIHRLDEGIFSQTTSLITINCSAVIEIGSKSFYNCNYISNISFPALKLIEQYAFDSCPSLTCFHAPQLSAMINTVGHYFNNSKSLKDVYVPNIKCIFGSYAFYSCSSLQSVSLHNLLYCNSGAFQSCKSLNSLEIDKLVTVPSEIAQGSSIKYISCQNAVILDEFSLSSMGSLERVNMPNIVYAKNASFYYLSKLIEIEMNRLVYLTSFTFTTCYSIRKIEFPNLKAISGNINIRYIYYVPNLEYVSFPKLVYFSHRTAFYGTKSLQCEMPNLIYGYGVFYDCQALTNITLPKIILASLMFYNCKNLVEAHLPAAKVILSYSFQNCESLKLIDIKEVCYLVDRTFEYCKSIKELYCPKLIRAGEYAFYHCNSLVTVDMPLLHYSEGYLFTYCLSLEELTLESLYYVENDGINGGNLKSLKLPKLAFLTGKIFSVNEVKSFKLESRVIVPKDLRGIAPFSGMEELEITYIPSRIAMASLSKNLKIIRLPNLRIINTESFKDYKSLEVFEAPRAVIIYRNAFSGCTNLKEIIVPSLILMSGSYKFLSCTSLTKFEAPSLLNIPEDTFSSCINLKTINAPKCIIIGGDSFKNCSLENLSLESLIYCTEGVSSNLESLKSLILPNIHRIEDNLLQGMTNLEYISAGVTEISLTKPLPLKKVDFPNLLSINDQYFANSPLLEEFSANNLISLLNGGNFANNTALKLIKMPKLFHIDTSNTSIIENCTSLQDFYLGSSPPYTFYNDTFKDIKPDLHLPYVADFLTYDNSVIIEGDAKNDIKWCGLELRGLIIGVKINGNADVLIGSNLDDATKSFTESIQQIEILYGKMDTTDFIDSNGKKISDRYPQLSKLLINEDVLIENPIPDEVFMDNTVLTHINLGPIKVLSNNQLKGCSNLVTIEGPCLEELADSSLSGLLSITKIELLKVVLIHSSCFLGCSKLESVNLPALLTIEGSNHFQGCTKLSNVSMPSLKTISNTNDLFKDCHIKTLTFPSIPPNQFADGYSFVGKDTELILPNFEDYYVYDNDTFGSDKVNDGKWRGINLKPIQFIMKVNDDKECFGETYDDALTKCSLTEEITKMEIIMGEVKSSDFPKFKLNERLECLIIKDSVKIENKIIPDNAFAGHGLLEQVIIKGVVTIGASSFSNNVMLQSISFPDCEEIKTSAFQSCENLNETDIPLCSIIGNKAFQDCVKIVNISIPKITKLGDLTFKGCSELNDIGQTLLLESAGDECFYGCGFKEFRHYALKSIGNSCFKGCTRLTDVVLDVLIDMGDNVFEGNAVLDLVKLPKVLSIKPFTVANCTKLYTFEAESAISIEEKAFFGCGIGYLDFPSVTTINGKEQFRGCKQLNRIYLKKLETISPENNLIFDGCPLRNIYLGSRPPSTFHKDVFANIDDIYINLPNDDDYYTYDNDVSVEGDVAADGYFAGVLLRYVYVQELFINGISINTTLISVALTLLNITEAEVVSINVVHNYRSEEFVYGRFPNLRLLEINGYGRVVLMNKCFYMHENIEIVRIPTVTKIGNSAFEHCLQLREVLISEGSIGDYAFNNCENLASISTKYVDTLGLYSFSNCSSLEEIYFPYITTIPKYCFSGCSSLRGLDFPKAVTIYSNSFDGCTGLTYLKFDDLYGLTNYMFANLENLSSIDMPNLYSVSIGGFANNPSLETVCLPSLEKIYEGAFKDCINLHTLNASELKTVGDEAFSGCINLKTIISDLLSSIGNKTFKDCVNLHTLNANELKTVGDEAFSGCINLKTIISDFLSNIGNKAFKSCSFTEFSFSSVTTLDNYTFQDCQLLETVNLDQLTSCGVGTFEGLKSLRTVNVPSLTTLNSEVFSGCVNIISVDVTSVKIITGYNHFANCKRLEEIKLPKLVTVDTVDSIFLNCFSLHYIYMVNPPTLFHRDVFVMRNTDIILRLFTRNDDNFDNDIRIPGDVKNDKKWCGLSTNYKSAYFDIEINGEKNSTDNSNFDRHCYYAGYKKENGKYLDITSMWVIKGVLNENSYSGMRTYFPNLVNFTISPDVELYGQAVPAKCFANHTRLRYIHAANVLILRNLAFYNCQELLTVDMPNIKLLGDSCFENCISLKSVNFNSIKEISTRSFAGCTSLSSLSIDKLEIAAESAFNGCSSLIMLKLNNVKELLGDNIFEDCSKLKSIELGSLEKVDSNSPNLFKGCSSLENISLSSNPPNAFHPLVFSGKDLLIILPNFEDYQTYDDSFLIQGDKPYDRMWCGISFADYMGVYVSVNGKDEVLGNSMTSAIINSGETTIHEISVYRGIMFNNDFIDMKKNYPDLRKLTIKSGVTVKPDLIPKNSFNDHLNIEYIEFYGISRIEDNAFANCIKLTTIIAPDLQEIGIGAFNENSALESIELNVTKIDIFGFYGCPKLNNIKLDKLESVGQSAFENCLSLVEISLNNLNSLGFSTFREDTELVTVTMNKIIELPYSCFMNCAKLTNINIPNLKIVGESAFQSCESIIAVPSSTITEIHSRAFKNCVLLEQISLESLNVCGEESLYGTAIKSFENNILASFSIAMFSNCKSLKSVKSSRVTNIQSNCFKNCEALQIIEFLSLMEIGDNAFINCIELVEVHLDRLTNLGKRAFANCLGLNRVTLELLTELNDEVFENDVSLEIINIPNVDTVGYRTFYNCSMLEEIIFYQRVSLSDQSFNRCINLTSISGEISTIGQNCFESCIDLRSIDTTNTESIGSYAFIECNSLDRLVFNELIYAEQYAFAESGITSIVLEKLEDFNTGIFKNCVKLTSVESPALTTLIGGEHFANCIELKSLTCRNLLTVDPAYDTIFDGCINLESIKLGSSPPIRFNSQVFLNANSTNLIDIDLPNYDDYITYDNSAEYVANGDKENDKMWCNIKLSAFYTKVRFNDGNVILGSSIDDCLLESGLDASEIKSILISGGTLSYQDLINISSNFTNLENFTAVGEIHMDKTIIVEGAFQDLTNLKEVLIETITQIGVNAFANCTNLRKVTLSDVVSIDPTVFDGSTGLEYIEMPLITEISASFFEGMESLVSMIAPKVTKINEKSFKGCIKLKSIEFPELVTIAGVEHFMECSELESVNLGSIVAELNVDPSNSNIFNDCSKLKEVYLPKSPPKTFNKDVFTNRNSAIEMKLMLPNFEDYYTYDKNTDIDGDAADDGKWCGITLLQIMIVVKFNDGNEVKGINLLNAATTSAVSEITKIEIIEGKLDETDFVQNTDTIKTRYPNLAEFIVNDNVVINSATKTLPENSFTNHVNIKTVVMNGFEILAANSFKGCSKIESITMNGLTTIPASSFSELVALKYVTFNKVKIVESLAFNGCPSLQKIEIPNLEEVGENAFKGCSSDLLEHISFPSLIMVTKECFMDMKIKTFDLPSATIIKESAFKGCVNIQSIVLAIVETIEQSAFMNCANLIDIEAPSLISLGINVFNGCVKLKKVKFNVLSSLPSEIFMNLELLTNIEMPRLESAENSVFKGCKSIETISLPNLKICGNNMFTDCELLKNVNLPLLNKMGDECFIGCNSLDFISLPSIEIIGRKGFYSLTNLKNAIFEVATKIEESAFELCESLKEIIIDGVNVIENRAFFSCSSLTNINFDLLNSIGDSVFEKCSSLELIDFPKVANIGSRAFADCILLRSANLPLLEKVSEELFINCITLEEIIIDAALELHGSCFKNCSSLTEINGNKVLRFIGADQFADCVELTKISFLKLEECESSNVGLFSNCHSLVDIYFPEYPPKTMAKGTFDEIMSHIKLNLPSPDSYYNYDDDASIIGDEIGDSKWCGISFPFLTIEVSVNGKEPNVGNSITTAVLRSKENVVTTINVTKGKLSKFNFVTRDNKTISQLFPDLQGFYIESSVDIEDKLIAANTFANHQSLTEVIIDAAETIGDECFANCPKLKKVVLPKVKNTFNNIFVNDILLEEVRIPLMKEIPDNAFSGLTSLVTVDAPLKTSIGSNAFTDCKSIIEIDLQLVERLGDFCFKNCDKITTIDLPLLNEYFNSPFEGCTSLEVIKLGSLVSFPDNAFANLTLLTNVIAPVVTRIGRSAFLNCKSITAINYPEVIKLGDYCFSGCEKLKSIELQKFDGIFSNLFDGCVALEHIVFPALRTIPSNGFSNLSPLKTIEAPQVTEIENYAFQNCVNLVEFDFPLVTKLGTYCFKGCSKLHSIKFPLFNDKFTSGIFEGCDSLEEISFISIIEIPNAAFGNLESLVSVNISNAEILGYSSFTKCRNLTTVDVTKVNKISKECFSGCSSLVSIIFPSLKDFTDGYYAFNTCKSLSFIGLPVLETIPAYGIFEGCYNFKIQLPSTPPTIENPFLFDNKNATLILPSIEDYYTYDDNIDKDTDKKADCMWQQIKLYQIYNYVSVNDRNEVLCSSLKRAYEWYQLQISEVKKITIKSGSTILGRDKLSEFINLETFESDSQTLTTIPAEFFKNVPKLKSVRMEHISVVESHAFYNCPNLISVDLPGVTTIKGTNHFSFDSSLTTITLTSLETVESDDTDMFSGCTKLKWIYFPDSPPNVHHNLFKDSSKAMLILDNLSSYYEYDDNTEIEGDKIGDCRWSGIHFENITRKITVNGNSRIEGSSIYHAIIYSKFSPESFEKIEIEIDEVLDRDIKNYVELLTNLKELSINTKTSFTIPKIMFSGHPKLQKVKLNSIISLGDSCFEKCKDLNHFEYIEDENLLKENGKYVGNRAFAECTSLTNISLKDATELGQEAFCGCTMLSSIAFDSLSKIKSSAFAKCASLVNVELANVKTLEGDSHFMDCTNLYNVSFSSLESVEGENIFSNCKNLTYISLPSTPPTGFTNNTFANRKSNNTLYLVTPSLNDLKNYDPKHTGEWNGIVVQWPAPTGGPDEDSGSGSNAGAIAGGTIGAILAVIIVVFVVLVILRKKNQEQSKNTSDVDEMDDLPNDLEDVEDNENVDINDNPNNDNEHDDEDSSESKSNESEDSSSDVSDKADSQV